jgi:uncharacterized protein (DUF1800 family)
MYRITQLLVLTDFHRYLQMGEMLTYVNSKAAHYKWHQDGELLFPDENYARELFQLFTTGLTRLNMDGTPILDVYSNPIKTFDTKDIVSFGRAWTGRHFELFVAG